MATHIPEYIFEASKQKYEQAQKTITEICDIVKTVQPDFDTSTARVCFDLIIQTCLLNAAAQDGKLDQNESLFITSVTRYADILKLVSSEIQKNQSPASQGFDWEQIATFNAEQLNKLAIESATIVDPYAETLVSIFAIVDKLVNDRNYREELDGSVGAMFVGLSGVDGDDLESEKATLEGCRAFAIYDKMVDKKWKRIVEG